MEKQYVYGYKGFKVKEGKLFCRDMQYEMGKVYTVDRVPKACNVGLHFCEKLEDVFSHYKYDRDDNKSVYYKVRASGLMDKGDDKIAAQELELMEPVSNKELFEALLSKKMQEADDIMSRNPNAILGGSLALILTGWMPFRETNDVDITLPFYSTFDGCEILSQWGDSGQECMKVGEKNGLSFDVFINPLCIWKEIEFKGKKYKVSEPKFIIEAKFRYWMKGKLKHAKDFQHIFETFRQNNGKNLCIGSKANVRTRINSLLYNPYYIEKDIMEDDDFLDDTKPHGLKEILL